jgi:hypothetical protein
MSYAIIEKLGKFVELNAQYEALVVEQHAVTDQVITSATMARLEAIDLELVRWEAVYQSEIRALECWCKSATPRGSQDWLDQR